MGSGSNSPFVSTAPTVAGVARVRWRRPSWTTGAWSQRPMQGARSTRMRAGSSSASSAARSASAPASWQGSESHTRTVSVGGAGSPSRTTSKWA